MPEKESKEPQPETVTHRNKITPIALPYIQGLSENLRRIFKTHNIPSYHKPVNNLRSQLVRPKDNTPIQSQCGVIYHIKCPDCQKDYVGETGRNLGTRFKEHTNLKGSNSAIKEHQDNTGHRCTIKNIKILGKEDHWYRRKVKESLMILRHKPSLNRDRGLELPPVYSTLLSRDSRESRDNSPLSQSQH